jgi:hypothetical protein
LIHPQEEAGASVGHDGCGISTGRSILAPHAVSARPRARVGRVAVEIAAESVFEEERVEVQEQPVAHRAVRVI